MAYKKKHRQSTLLPTIQRDKRYLRVMVKKPGYPPYAGATLSFRTGQMYGATDYFPQLARAMTPSERQRFQIPLFDEKKVS